MSLSRIKEWLDGEILEADDLNIEFNNITNNAIIDIVEDTTPQLGAHLDMNNFGLSFPATQAPDAGANILDDYEEGTWTPTLAFGDGITGITYNYNVGGYTKIGRMVFLTGYIALSSKGTSVGAATLEGFPFSVKAGNAYYSSSNFRFSGITFADMMVGIVDQDDTRMRFEEVTNAGTKTTLTNTNFVNNTTIAFSLQYQT